MRIYLVFMSRHLLHSFLDTDFVALGCDNNAWNVVSPWMRG